MLFWIWLTALAVTVVAFSCVAARRLLIYKVRKLVQRDCIFQMEADIKSLAAKSLPLYEAGLSRKEQALEVQHDVNAAMAYYRTLSTKALLFILRSFREQPKTMPETINAVISERFLRDCHDGLDLNTAIRNVVFFQNVHLGTSSENYRLLDKLREADEVFNHETLDHLTEKDKAWAERILAFLIHGGFTHWPVPVETVRFLRDDPDSLNHMIDYSQERGIRLNKVNVSALQEYLNADAMPLRNGML